MKQRIVGIVACTGLGLAMLGTANATPVAYEIGSYSEGGYSASWLHGATGCATPGYGGTLYMCGDPLQTVSGIIEGDLVGGFLTITGGSLLIDGLSYGVGGAALDFLGTAFGVTLGKFEIEGHGVFYYEPFSMGSGLPNYFDGNEMILWGQNLAAYVCTPDNADACHYGPRWGIDIYGKRISVPEPGTVGLFGLGLLAMAAVRRRKAPVSTS